jgi:hypothetical protein
MIDLDQRTPIIGMSLIPSAALARITIPLQHPRSHPWFELAGNPGVTREGTG